MFQERSYLLRAYFTCPLIYRIILTPACCGFVAIFTLDNLFNQNLSSTSQLLRVIFWQNASSFFDKISANALCIVIAYPIQMWLHWISLHCLCFSSHREESHIIYTKVITMDGTVLLSNGFWGGKWWSKARGKVLICKFCGQYVRSVESQYYSCVKTAALYFCRLLSVLHRFLSLLFTDLSLILLLRVTQKSDTYTGMLFGLEWIQSAALRSCEIFFIYLLMHTR